MSPPEKAIQIFHDQNQSAFTRAVKINRLTSATEILIPWEVRGGEDLGLIGLTENTPSAADVGIWIRGEAVLVIILP